MPSSFEAILSVGGMSCASCSSSVESAARSVPGVDGIRVEPGEAYTFVEGGNGELGFFIVSDGTGHPWKLKIRSPSSSNLQALKFMAEGAMVSDVVAIIGSIDPVMGEADK